MEDEFLPVGSIVKLKNIPGKRMIMGFLSYDKNDKEKKIYDYASCFYPFGYTDNNHLMFFNKEDIEEVYYEQYATDFNHMILHTMNNISREVVKKLIAEESENNKQ